MDSSELVLCIIALIVIVTLIILVDIKNIYTHFARIDIQELKTPLFPYGNLESSPSKDFTWYEQISELYRKACKRKYKFCGIYIYIKPCILSIDPELSKILIMDKNFRDKSPLYESPSLNLSHMDNEEIFETFTSENQKKLLELEKHINPGMVVDVKDLMEKYVIDVLASFILGVHCDTINNPESQIYKFSKQLLDKCWRPTFKEQLLERMPFGTRKSKREDQLEGSFSFFRTLIKEVIQSRKEDKIHRSDIVDAVFNGKIGSEDLEEACLNCFHLFAYYLRVISCISTFCIYELSKDMNIQDKLRAEVRNFNDNSKNKISNMKELHHLNKIIKETIRKYPPMSTLYKLCSKEYKDDTFGIKIAEGCEVIIPIYSNNHNAVLYPEPLKFDVERFSLGNQDEVSISFIETLYESLLNNSNGFRYGDVILKIILSTLVRNYEIAVVDDDFPLEIAESGFLLSMGNQISVRMKKMT